MGTENGAKVTPAGEAGKPMKVLICLLHPGYMRYYYTTIQELARRGHSIDLVFDDPVKQSKDRLHDQLVTEYPDQITIVPPARRSDGWGQLARALSWGMDFARYLTPRFREAERLRTRVELNIHPWFRTWLVKMPGVRSAFGIRVNIALLRRFYDALPAGPEVVRLIKSRQPDVVLVTPLVTQGNPQCEYVKAARASRVPVAHAVASWDNLSSKGLIRGRPDRVLLWNHSQRKEAAEMHAIRKDQVDVTGAQLFDDWFARRPSTSRRQFLERAGLDPEQPFVLYLCSSVFMAPNETRLILRFIDRLRKEPGMEKLGVLIRPYPEHVTQWETVDLKRRSNAALWPPAGEYPLTEEARCSFYDSIFHAEAVVGVNTSAMIESAIIGKPVFTVLAEEFNDSQVNTIHFGYMRRENGGFLQVTRDLDTLCTLLGEVLEDGAGERQRILKFVERFIRPHGLDQPCVPRLADAIERLREVDTSTRRTPVSAYFLRPILWPIRVLVNRVAASKKWQARRGLWKKAAREAEALGIDPLEHAARKYFKIDRLKIAANGPTPEPAPSRGDIDGDIHGDIEQLKSIVEGLRADQRAIGDRLEKLEALIEELSREPVSQL